MRCNGSAFKGEHYILSLFQLLIPGDAEQSVFDPRGRVREQNLTETAAGL